LSIYDFKKIIIGGYDIEEKAARAYDMAALKYWGPSTRINFPVMINFFPISLSIQVSNLVLTVTKM
jgi:hypothetical protein